MDFETVFYSVNCYKKIQIHVNYSNTLNQTFNIHQTHFEVERPK